MESSAPLAQARRAAPAVRAPERRACLARLEAPKAMPVRAVLPLPAVAPVAIAPTELPAPRSLLASLDLTPARCKALRVRSMYRVVIVKPDAAEIEAQVQAAVAARTEAAEEIRQIVIVSAPATL